MYHVFSTLANSQRYVKYADTPQSNLHIVEREVLIQGGSGIARKSVGTTWGVHTAVSDEDMAWLKDNPSFQQHMANGYIRAEKRQANPEAVAADMSTRQWVRGPSGEPIRGDAFPITPQDFSDKPAGKDLTAIVPKTNKAA